MANKFTRYLGAFAGGAVSGLTNPKGVSGNWTHATKVFVDNTYRLSPKQKFLFYVQFEIDKSVMKAKTFSAKHTDEVSVLVKSADLPKFNFDSVIKNQYNRKKILYKQINYDPVNLTLHDDSAGVVNALWAIYYGHYITDRHLPDSAWEANHLRPAKTEKDKFRYGMDVSLAAPLFKSISIYTMSRRRFIGYTLINPRIKSWNHGSVAYSEGDTIESQMTLEYEAVRYTAGNVRYGNPKGFATLHYDTLPSPLSILGGGVGNLLGSGGVLDGLEQVFGDFESGNAFSSPGNFLGTAIKAINTAKNIKSLSKDGLTAEIIGALTSPAAIGAAVSTVGGVVGAVFPKSTSNSQTTQGTQKRVIGTAAFTGQPVTPPGE